MSHHKLSVHTTFRGKVDCIIVSLIRQRELHHRLPFQHGVWSHIDLQLELKDFFDERTAGTTSADGVGKCILECGTRVPFASFYKFPWLPPPRRCGRLKSASLRTPSSEPAISRGQCSPSVTPGRPRDVVASRQHSRRGSHPQMSRFLGEIVENRAKFGEPSPPLAALVSERPDERTDGGMTQK